MADKKLKICVYSMDGIGHIAACVGVMQPLIERGHDVFFIATEEHKGKLAKFGAREHIIVREMSPEEREAQASAAKDAGKRLLESGLLSDKGSFEKIQLMKDMGFLQMLGKFLDDQQPAIAKILEEEKPDLILIDHFMVAPCFVKAKIPFVLIHSPSPLFVYNDERLPPAFSGYPVRNPDLEQWKKFREVCNLQFFGPIKEFQYKLFEEAKVDYPKYDNNIIMSPYMNVYAYPKELDYSSIVPTPANVFQIDAFSREMPEGTTEDFKLPDDFINRDKDVGLIYLSMGSMGGADIEMMKRLIGIVSQSKHKFIVVKGPRGDEYEVNSPNIVAGNFLPQTVLLPKCDLVITHGGNNSTTETFFAGKPMIDQWDNAMRVEECGFGCQFNPYRVTKEELLGAIDSILADEEIKVKLAAAIKRMKSENLKVKLAEKLEQIAAEGYKSF